MIAVAQDLVYEIAAMPLAKIGGVIMFCLLLFPHVEGFVHDDKTETVATIKELGRRWVMRGPDGVAAHLLQYSQLPKDRGGIDGGAQRTQVMMQTNAAYLQRTAVQKKTLPDIETEGPDPHSSD